MKTLTYSEVERLNMIRYEMRALLKEAWKLVEGTSQEARAKGYWYAQIRMALDNDHTFLGSASCAMDETIEALEEEAVQ